QRPLVGDLDLAPPDRLLDQRRCRQASVHGAGISQPTGGKIDGRQRHAATNPFAANREMNRTAQPCAVRVSLIIDRLSKSLQCGWGGGRLAKSSFAPRKDDLSRSEKRLSSTLLPEVGGDFVHLVCPANVAVVHDQSGTTVPPQQCVVVGGRPENFG